MIELQYKRATFRSMLDQMFAALHTELVENTLNIPSTCGHGFFKLLDLPAGIQTLVYNLHLNDDLLLIREKTGTEFYMLTFDEVNKAGSAGVRINEEENMDTQRKSAIYLTRFLYNIELSLQKNTTIHGIRILLPLS